MLKVNLWEKCFVKKKLLAILTVLLGVILLPVSIFIGIPMIVAGTGLWRRDKEKSRTDPE